MLMVILSLVILNIVFCIYCNFEGTSRYQVQAVDVACRVHQPEPATSRSGNKRFRKRFLQVDEQRDLREDV